MASNEPPRISFSSNPKDANIKASIEVRKQSIITFNRSPSLLNPSEHEESKTLKTEVGASKFKLQSPFSDSKVADATCDETKLNAGLDCTLDLPRDSSSQPADKTLADLSQVLQGLQETSADKLMMEKLLS